MLLRETQKQQRSVWKLFKQERTKAVKGQGGSERSYVNGCASSVVSGANDSLSSCWRSLMPSWTWPED